MEVPNVFFNYNFKPKKPIKFDGQNYHMEDKKGRSKETK